MRFNDWKGALLRGSVMLAVVLALALLAACGGGDDADEPDDSEIATVAPGGPTSTQQADDEPTSTPAAPDTPAATATITPSPTPEPPTPTPTRTPPPTATPFPTVETPFANVKPVGQALENYTLDYSARFDGEEDEDGEVELRIEQTNPASYHLQVTAVGQQTESWLVNDIVYVRGEGGAVVELPGLVDRNLYAPSSFLVLVPNLAGIESATLVDEQADVGGRSATHYLLDPEDAAAFRPSQREVGDDVEGTFDVWVDNELGIVLQMTVVVEWSAGAGSTQAIGIDYLVSNVNATPEIQAPV